MTPETFKKANILDDEIDSIERELTAWESIETAKVLNYELRSAPTDVFTEYKRKCKEHLQKLIDKKRAELAAL